MTGANCHRRRLARVTNDHERAGTGKPCTHFTITPRRHEGTLSVTCTPTVQLQHAIPAPFRHIVSFPIRHCSPRNEPPHSDGHLDSAIVLQVPDLTQPRHPSSHTSLCRQTATGELRSNAVEEQWQQSNGGSLSKGSAAVGS